LPAYNAATIPNYPNYFLGAETGSICDSLHIDVPIISSDIKSFTVFPNPVSSSEVSFTYPVSSTASVLLINNIEGKQMARYTLPQWSSFQKIKLPVLSPGIYIARLQNERVNTNVKFVVE
jgi:hypothetical protein